MSLDAPYDEAAAAWLRAFGVEDVDPGVLGVAFAPRTYKEVLDGALALGRAAGRLPAAMRVLAEGEARLRRLRDHLGLARAGRASERLPSVVVIERLDPLTLAGRWVPDLVAHAGGRPVLVEPGQPSGTLPWDALASAEPDVVIAAPEVAAQRALRGAAGRVCLYSGPPLDVPGTGLVDAVERLAALLHPDRVG